MEGGLSEEGLMTGTSEEGTGTCMDGGREGGGWIERGKDGAREQGSKGGKLQGRHPDEGTGQYTVYPQTIPQRGLAIDTFLLQMKNSEHVYVINSVWGLGLLFVR